MRIRELICTMSVFVDVCVDCFLSKIDCDDCEDYNCDYGLLPLFNGA